METELKGLIDTIKKEGVLEAEKNAGEIIKKSEKKAGEIIASAEKKKNTIIKEAETKSETLKINSENTMKQAARDVLLTLREDAVVFFERIVKEKVSDELLPNILKEIIVKAAGNLTKSGISDIEVLVGEKDKARLEKTLFSSFRQEAGKRIKLTEKKGIRKGFRIGESGKDSYFDFTDEAIAEAFKKYLTPRLAEMLNIDGPSKK